MDRPAAAGSAAARGYHGREAWPSPRPACAACAAPRPPRPRPRDRLDAADLVLPLFVEEGLDGRAAVRRCPGSTACRWRAAVEEAGEAAALGMPAVLLFGIPAEKDAEGSGAWDDEGIVQLATRAIKEAHPDLLVIADLCLCEYTDHGHCGAAARRRRRSTTTPRSSCSPAPRSSQAAPGADVVAPSDMMDGRVAAIRAALDDEGFADTPIMAYSAKFASAFYGPFRDAADSTPAFGDRRGYQMDPGNGRRGGARGAARRRGGRRHRHGQARARPTSTSSARVKDAPAAGRGVQRQRRVRDGQGGGRRRASSTSAPPCSRR